MKIKFSSSSQKVSNAKYSLPTATKTLAVIGAIAIVSVFIWEGAVLTKRFAPDTYGTLAGALFPITTLETLPVKNTDEVVVEPTTTAVAETSEDAEHTKTLTAGEQEESVYALPSQETVLTSQINGQVDLAPRVISVGAVNRDTGIFTPSETINTNERAAVHFEVKNIGTKTSPQWSFNVVLPTLPKHIFSSNMQKPLAPGERIEFTLGFDRFDMNSDGVVIINVDPTRGLNEKDKENNIVKTTISTVK
jgi:hypothetical protein